MKYYLWFLCPIIGVVVNLTTSCRPAIVVPRSPVEALPDKLSFEASVDDPVILSVDLSSVTPLDSHQVQITSSGHRFDFRVEQISTGLVRVQLAPMTWTAGEVLGEIAVSIPDQEEPLSIAVAGTIHPWITISPTVINLGMLDAGATSERRHVKLTVASKDRAFGITGVDAEQACGWLQSYPKEERLEQEVELEFDLTALAKRYQSGDIIREVVTLHTTHPRAETVRIQVIAAVKRNATK
ncbi:hypothetical protein BH11VER1_BH11VER1_34690 [soil metagenome]